MFRRLRKYYRKNLKEQYYYLNIHEFKYNKLFWNPVPKLIVHS